MTDDYRPRFSFEISEEQKQRADKLIVQYGLRKSIFGKILDEVLDIIEEHGGMAIGIMMSPDIKVKDIIPAMKEVEKFERKE